MSRISHSRRAAAAGRRGARGSGIAAARCYGRRARPIQLGTLTPLTGAGGPYGAAMVKARQGGRREVNAAGGVLGRQIELVVEDDQTNPEAGVRAARKLIDVDKVSAIMRHLGLGGDHGGRAAVLGDQDLPHHRLGRGHDHPAAAPGLPDPHPAEHDLQGRKFGEFGGRSRRRQARVLPRAADAVRQEPVSTTSPEAVQKGGGRDRALIYDDKKTSLPHRGRPGAALQARRGRPRRLHAGHHRAAAATSTAPATPAARSRFGYSAQPEAGRERAAPKSSRGAYTIVAFAAEGSQAYARLMKLIGVTSPDPYSAQVYDQVNLVAAGDRARPGEATGTAIQDNVRKIVAEPGRHRRSTTPSRAEGDRGEAAGRLRRRQRPVRFHRIGDIEDCKFRYEQVQRRQDRAACRIA